MPERDSSFLPPPGRIPDKKSVPQKIRGQSGDKMKTLKM